MQTEPPKKSPDSKPGTITSRYATVNVGLGAGNNLDVDPQVVHVKKPGRGNPREVRWNIDPAVVPEGGSIEIDFSEALGTRGPFEASKAHNKQRGRYQKKKHATMEIDSGDTDVDFNPSSRGNWYYGVTVFDQDGTVMRFCDPGVAIDEEDVPKGGN